MLVEETIEIFKAIKTLIEAYEKQSKEIEELKENMRKRVTYCNEIEKDLFENCSNYVISKDKIKAKIEEFKQVRDEILRNEKEFNRPMMTYDLKRNDYCEKMLQSLLEEE